jgi:hypothetical protein
MTRRVEGTTLAGYKCDAVGCDANGVWAPVVCVPYHDLPVDLYRPVVLFRDIHVCNVHWFDIRIDDQLTPAVRRAVREAALAHGIRPDFERTYLKRVACHSEEFLTFQQMMKLVPENDALVEGAIDAP